MTRYLVSGAEGFIAGFIASALVENGHTVIGIDDLSAGLRNGPKGAKAVNLYQFHPVDIAEYQKVEEIFMASRPEVVLHLAAQAHEAGSFYDPYRITRSNSYISSIIFELAIRYGVRKIVYFSSTARYGDQKAPFVETMRPQAADIYGSQKIATEEMLRMLCDLHGVAWTIVVPRNVFGPGESMHDLYRNFITLTMNKILRGEKITIFGKGHVRSFSYIEDSLPSFLKVADPDIANGEIINIGGLKQTTIEAAAREIVKCFPEYEIPPIVELPPRYGEVEAAYCSAEKSVALLNYEEKIGWIKGIKRTADWAKTQGPQEWRRYFLPLLNESAPLPWREYDSRANQGRHSLP